MSAIENILGMLPDRVGDGKNSQIYTPPHIAEEMVNALPEDIWNKDTTFLDICCKSGIFLYKIYQKLMESPSMVEAFPDETDRATHIIHKQLFGIAPSIFCQMFSTRTVYGYLDPESHIISFGDNYNHVMKNQDRRFLIETLKKEFNTVKFDVVIGNPPYNRGMDLDFVDLGYKLSNKYTCMITPAKWQTAEADQSVSSKISYGQFRQLYVPHMNKLCFYPDCKDVFDIEIAEGVTWFLLNKSTNENCEVITKCRLCEDFNSTQKRDIKARQCLNNFGNEVIEHLNKYEKFTFNQPINKRFQVWTSDLINPGKVDTSMLFSKSNNLLVIRPSEIIDKNTGINPSYTSPRLVFSADTEIECKYFLSWLNSKFTRFFIMMNISSRGNVLTNDYFRFVPAPAILDHDGNRVHGKFDHIYTDKELYETFNLPQKYIDVIEAVIKERK